MRGDGSSSTSTTERSACGPAVLGFYALSLAHREGRLQGGCDSSYGLGQRTSAILGVLDMPDASTQAPEVTVARERPRHDWGRRLRAEEFSGLLQKHDPHASIKHG